MSPHPELAQCSCDGYRDAIAPSSGFPEHTSLLLPLLVTYDKGQTEASGY